MARISDNASIPQRNPGPTRPAPVEQGPARDLPREHATTIDLRKATRMHTAATTTASMRPDATSQPPEAPTHRTRQGRTGDELVKRMAALAAATMLALATMATPASAHILVVDPPGAGDPAGGWVGGPALPGQGQGLIPGGPGGDHLQSPAHAKGLNTACHVQRTNDSSAVDIFGPGGPGCPHGS